MINENGPQYAVYKLQLLNQTYVQKFKTTNDSET